jgi:hypothetical protein
MEPIVECDVDLIGFNSARFDNKFLAAWAARENVLESENMVTLGGMSFLRMGIRPS